MSFCLQVERWMGFPESLFYRFCWQLHSSTSFQALFVLFIGKTQTKTKQVHLIQILQRKRKGTLPTEKFVFNHFIVMCFINTGCPGALGTHRQHKPGTFALLQNLSLATNIKHDSLTELCYWQVWIYLRQYMIDKRIYQAFLKSVFHSFHLNPQISNAWGMWSFMIKSKINYLFSEIFFSIYCYVCQSALHLLGVIRVLSFS